MKHKTKTWVVKQQGNREELKTGENYNRNPQP